MIKSFRLEDFFILIRGDGRCPCLVTANVKVSADGRVTTASAEGDTAERALSLALSLALKTLFNRNFNLVVPHEAGSNPSAYCNYLLDGYALQINGRGEYGQGD